MLNRNGHTPAYPSVRARPSLYALLAPTVLLHLACARAPEQSEIRSAASSMPDGGASTAAALASSKAAAREALAEEPESTQKVGCEKRYSEPRKLHGTYDKAKAAVERKRAKLIERYRATKDPKKRAAILKEAELTLAASISSDLIPYWVKTPWRYSGTTQKPGEGKIACGYFVSTVLRDAGLEVERVKLAQQASENIIRSLTHKSLIRRFRNTPLKEFVAAVDAMGKGVYIVGLDSHVGFIVHDGREVWFVHSSSLPPRCVVRERAIKSTSLRTSKYHVVGPVTVDRALVWKWLTGVSIPTRTK